jgi:hypothetical protein
VSCVGPVVSSIEGTEVISCIRVKVEEGLAKLMDTFPVGSTMKVVIDTGPGISGGYTDRGTTDTDKDTDFCILIRIRTPIRHTHTPHCGYVTRKSSVFFYIIFLSFFKICLFVY